MTRQDKPDRLKLLLTGLATGDSLGSTSEFTPRQQVPAVYARYATRGWPFRQVGGGMWEPGEPTDDTDMALCLVRSYLEKGCFDGEDVAHRFVEWKHRGPKDIGGTTSRTLSRVASGAPWFEGGLREYLRNPGNAANGSLMRNGVIPGMAENLEDAFRMSLCQGIITHYSPLAVLCCAAQSYLLWESLEGRQPLSRSWLRSFCREWNRWIEGTSDEVSLEWRDRVGTELASAWEILLAADFDPDRFNPFEVSFDGREGYSLLTLQIAVWAAEWSLRDKRFPTPHRFPREVFERTGVWTLSWVAMVGHDSDTYGASAGPLIVALHGSLPAELTDGLRVLKGL